MTTATRTVAKPFIKWAGGKGQILDQLFPYMPLDQVHTYYEPFLGGGAMYFGLWSLEPGRLPWKHAVLSDINPELINAYVQVRDQPETLMERLDRWYQDFLDDAEITYMQASAGGFEDPINRAARFIFLNKTCFNGLWRENSKGQFNVPCGVNPGALKLSRIYDRENILACSRALRDVELLCHRYSELIMWRCSTTDWPGHKWAADDFVYLDPPYWPVSGTSNFANYSSGGFKAEDQVWLWRFTKYLSVQQIQWALSNSDTPFIRSLYEYWPNKLIPISARRSINSDGNKRGPVQELLILPR